LGKRRKSIQTQELERIEAAFDRAIELPQLFHPGNTPYLPAPYSPQTMEAKTEMIVDFGKVITDKAEETRIKFRALLDKTNKETPSSKDVKALAELLSGNKQLELWRDIASAGYRAEILVIKNARATPAESGIVPKVLDLYHDTS
jgi:hypothetical protein